MFNRRLTILFFILLSGVLYSQSVVDSVITGKVTSKSVENIYIEFQSTIGISKGDTLFIKKGEEYFPSIRANYISSKSVAGELLGIDSLKTGDEVFAFIKIYNEDESIPTETGVVVLPNLENETQITIKETKTFEDVEPKVNGRITVQSYSNFTNLGSKYDYQRWRYAFKLSANNIGGSNLSYTQYINFAYRASEWNDVISDLSQGLRIYDLAFRYDFSESATLWFGRHLNRKISNLGAVDGLQFDNSFESFTLGLMVGSRPNLSDMSYNAKLFEYGVYLSRFDALGYRGMNNTLGYFEQTNDFKTDRRFLYFQHTNSAIKNTRIFLSTEVDLFKKVNGKSENELSLTSLFVSANIRPSRVVTFYLSYDARKNVIYYETFKNFIDSVFENETRQGFRARITLKPINKIFFGLNYGYRFRKGDLKPSNNYGGYVTYSMIPLIESGLTFSFSKINSSYLNGTIWSLRLYKDISWGMSLSLGYRNTKYDFTQNIDNVTQQSLSFSINTRLLNPVYVNLTYEGVFQSTRTSGRILINLSYRF